MPAIAKDENGDQLRYDILGGRAQILMYEDRDYSWHYRQLIKGKRNQRGVRGSSYINRCLDEPDLAKAILKAEDLYLFIQVDTDDKGEPIRRYKVKDCLLYTSPSPRDRTRSRMPSSA